MKFTGVCLAAASARVLVRFSSEISGRRPEGAG